MQNVNYFPHIEQILAALHISHGRLDGHSKVAVDVRLLRAVLQAVAARLPFDEAFYLTTYPDVAEAHRQGAIADPHQHYIERGFFEGRLGIAPEVDEAFYTARYKDVAKAVARGDVVSAAMHYQTSGIAEGRVPNAATQPVVDYWAAILQGDSGRA